MLKVRKLLSSLFEDILKKVSMIYHIIYQYIVYNAKQKTLIFTILKNVFTDN